MILIWTQIIKTLKTKRAGDIKGEFTPLPYIGKNPHVNSIKKRWRIKVPHKLNGIMKVNLIVFWQSK